MNLSKFYLKDLTKNIDFPKLAELEKLSSRNYSKKINSMEEIILFIWTLVFSLFRQIMPSNIVSGKMTFSSSGSLSIHGIKKWICSGFTYINIFEIFWKVEHLELKSTIFTPSNILIITSINISSLSSTVDGVISKRIIFAKEWE